MLSKTIKLGFSLLITAAFLTGCATTSDPDPDTETQASASTSQPAVATPPPAPAYVAPTPVAPALESVVYFDFDKSELRPETRALLTAHAAAMKTKPSNVVLEGHADERGTREYNMALGERRALAVRDFLRSEGVNSDIEVISYGEERPEHASSNESSWQQNRRVEIK
jgi:peptidoglycan-associated lipoprotein